MTMSGTASLSIKLMRIGAALLLLALTSIGLTLWVTWQLEGGAAAVNEAGRMRMQTWRLTSAVQAQLPPEHIATLVAEFDNSLSLLRNGDATRPLFVPWDDAVRREFAQVEVLWQTEKRLWLQIGGLDPLNTQRMAGDFVTATNRFVLAIESQLSGYTAILNLFQLVMMALAIVGAVVMLYTGYMYVINPLGQLRRGLARVEAGEFGTRVDVDTQDAVAVRWSDDANQRYLMLASDALPAEMLEEERSLIAGACACGNLKPDARTRVIPIHSHDALPMRHCAKAGYESLVSVPVRLQQRLIGEIALFFRAGARGGGGRRTLAAGARAARLHRPVARFPENSSAAAAQRNQPTAGRQGAEHAQRAR